MTELQSCASMVNASTRCGRSHGLSLLGADCNTRNAVCSSNTLVCEEKDVKVEDVDLVAEISAELEKERRKNTELMERISILEGQIQGREKASSPAAEQNGSHSGTFRSFKKFKRQKIEAKNDEVKEAEVDIDTKHTTQTKHYFPTMAKEAENQPDRMVNWMSMDETQFLNFEKQKDGDSMDCGDTDESDDDENDGVDETDVDDKDRDEDNYSLVAYASKGHIVNHDDALIDETNVHSSERSGQVKQEIHGDQIKGLSEAKPCEEKGSVTQMRELRIVNHNDKGKLGRQKAGLEMHGPDQVFMHKASGSLLSYRKPPKVAFCPKEVRRIMESEELLLKNAQSHTIRKIIVFASLGIRHGCEEMYELDFNHFKILRKGEPYVSPKDPGEHVLYEHPGVRKKVFYPNRQIPVLCPVQILEEEKAMRPSDPSCPSCLFLCIKYGGRTRNLPQNEYVRQRMGRNKLKSFGPLMCQMALLVNIRSGSFFFKAFGITLLFMAGFPDDIVQRETKYRNLDLLQKYYRTDKDAEGEELFRPSPTLNDTVIPNTQLLGKASSTAPKSQGKKQKNPVSELQNQQKSTIPSSVSPTPIPSAQFGLMGYASVHTQAISSMHSHALTNTSPTSNITVNATNSSMSHMGRSPPPYPMFPAYPINPFIPPSVWHNTNAYYPCPYPSSYGYHSIPHSINTNHHSQSYYGHPSAYPFVPNLGEVGRKEADSIDSNSGSSSSATKNKVS